MKQRAFVITLLLCLPAIAFAQQDGPYQVRYATNLNISDSIIDVTNTGANGSPAICVNVYGLTGPKLVHCCTCIVKSDALVALSVQKDLLANNNFPPDSMVIKLIATAFPLSLGCDAAKVGDSNHLLVQGMAAWSTVSQPLSQFSQGSNATETAFTDSTLSAAELANLDSKCNALGPGNLLCNSCND